MSSNASSLPARIPRVPQHHSGTCLSIALLWGWIVVLIVASAEFPALPSAAPVRPVVSWGAAAGAAASDSNGPSAGGAALRKLKTSRGDVLFL